jgi:hypothetical protein
MIQPKSNYYDFKRIEEFVAASPNKEWLQNYQMIISNKYIQHLSPIKGVVAIYDFVTSQAEGFSKYETIAKRFNRLKDKFIGTKEICLRY